MSGVISPTAATASSTPVTSTPLPQAAPALQPGASQFGQFRLTTFVDSNPNLMKTAASSLQSGKRKSMSGHASATQSPVVRPSSVPVGATAGPEKMAGKDAVTNNGDTTTTTTTNGAGNGNGNTENTSPTTFTAPAAHRRTASAAIKIPTGQHNGFGVLDLTPPLPPQQGKLGQHRDGRVRNPVPRKLKGKTDMRNGNFSVMHMDMSAHTSHDGGGLGGGVELSRGEQAQRTSENTAKAARVAALDKEAGKGGVKRRRVDGEGGWEPILSQASKVAIQPVGGVEGGVVQMHKEIVHRSEMMTKEEVKYEQARLLTLLRSLNPLAVVDQMCTALAFFGGIPGAPPPADGLNFPESEDANGSGSLFVGWLSEIFPDPQRRQWSSTKVQERTESIVQGKRPRGRPKGSKASKVRKDKGIKKGRKDGLPNNAPIPGAEDGDDPADDDWVDIVQGDNEAGPSGGKTNAEGGMIIDLDGETPSQAAGRRKPGRPRGSRNKDRERDADGNEIPSVDEFTLSSSSQQQNHIEGNSSSAFEQQPSPTDPQPKRKPGRPPGSKTKPKEGTVPPALKAPKPKTQKEGPTPPRAKSVISGEIPAGLAADERAVLEAYRKNKAIVGPATEISAPGDAMNKRKRKSRAKPKPNAVDGAATREGGENGEGGDKEAMLAQQLNSQAQSQQQQPSPTQQTAVPPPPPKRQRKAKEPATNTPAAKAASNTSNIDPSLQSSQPPSASPHLSATQSQNKSQSRPQSQQQAPARSISAHSATNNNPFASPPMNSMNNANMGNTMMSIESMMPSSQQSSQRTAQGLEAHYERFANQDSQSQSPNTYTMGGMNQPQQISQAHKQGQRSSPSVAQMMQRTGSQGQQRVGGGAVMRSPQKSATVSSMNSGGTSNMYYGQNQSQNQQQAQRHVPTQSSGYGYNASTGMSQNHQASRSNSYNLDAFGPTNSVRSSMNQLPSSSGVGGGQHQRANSGYGVQNQQGYFDGGNITGANYVDLPALETGLSGVSGGGYGVNPRSASYGGSAIGGNMGLQNSAGSGMGGGLFGTEGNGISESEMRERLLRGIGRRQ